MHRCRKMCSRRTLSRLWTDDPVRGVRARSLEGRDGTPECFAASVEGTASRCSDYAARRCPAGQPDVRAHDPAVAAAACRSSDGMMRRRAFVLGAGAMLTVPHAPEAQQVPRIGWLTNSDI